MTPDPQLPGISPTGHVLNDIEPSSSILGALEQAYSWVRPNNLPNPPQMAHEVEERQIQRFVKPDSYPGIAQP